ncbi:MAG: hypothetical protein HY460_00010 [Parcubacteria group bacterium]|nr:hypothetical protein [Parcubacteria group bacterium]
MTVSDQTEVIREHGGDTRAPPPGVTEKDTACILNLIKESSVAIEPREVIAEFSFLLRDDSLLVASEVEHTLFTWLYLDYCISPEEFYQRLASAEIPEIIRVLLASTQAQAQQVGAVSGMVIYRFPMNEEGKSRITEQFGADSRYQRWLSAKVALMRDRWRILAAEIA